MDLEYKHISQPTPPGKNGKEEKKSFAKENRRPMNPRAFIFSGDCC